MFGIFTYELMNSIWTDGKNDKDFLSATELGREHYVLPSKKFKCQVQGPQRTGDAKSWPLGLFQPANSPRPARG